MLVIKKNIINPINKSIISELPLSNFNTLKKNASFIKQHLIWLIFIFTALIQFFIYTFTWDFANASREQEFDEMNVTLIDMGDFINYKKKRISSSISYVEIDDVFGNQYLKNKKKKKLVDPDAENVTGDPGLASSIDGAVNPIIGNASAPIDLKPEITPEYTPVARSKGVEGALILELIIGKNGRVLRARPVGKKLGYGLEEAAVNCYKRKYYKPSIDKNLKPITVKIYQPVRFKLI